MDVGASRDTANRRRKRSTNSLNPPSQLQKKQKSAKMSPISKKNRKSRPRKSAVSSQSCHQCRQSIFSAKGMLETKEGKKRAKCATCTRYWCSSCLLNRYGLKVEEMESTGNKWSCPFCTKTCNCSICRKKAGMLATGILTPLAKTSGYDNVLDYLTKSSDEVATCLQWSSISEDDKREEAKSKKRSPKKKSPLKSAKKTPQKSYSPDRKPRACKHVTRSGSVSPLSPQRSGTGHFNLRQGFAYRPTSFDSAGNSRDETEDSDQSDDKMSQDLPLVATLDIEESSNDSMDSSGSDSSSKDVIELTALLECQSNFDQLRKKVLNQERGKLKEEKQKIKETLKLEREAMKVLAEEEKIKQRENLKFERQAKKIKLREERKEKKLQDRIQKQEELRVLMQAKREAKMKKHNDKKEQLKQLKEQDKQKRKLTLSVTLSQVDNKTPQSTEEALPKPLQLPEYDALSVAMDEKNIHQLLQVTAFFCTFKGHLNLPAEPNLGEIAGLCQSKINEKSLRLYTSLLHHLRQSESATRRNKIVSKLSLVKTLEQYVSETLENNSAQMELLDHLSLKSPDSHMTVLTFLIEEVLRTDTFRSSIEESFEEVHKLWQDQRSWERVKVKEINELLTQKRSEESSIEELSFMRESGMEEIRMKRREYKSKMATTSCSSRVQPLGCDRRGWLYWWLPGQPGMVVENKENKTWFYVGNEEKLNEILVALDVRDEDELQLHEAIELHQDLIVSSFPCN